MNSVVLPMLAAWLAQEPAVAEGSTGEGPRRFETALNGYLDTRLSWQHRRSDPLLPSDDVPDVANLSEGNLQLKLRWGDRAFALTDASFFFQKAVGFPGGDHDVETYRPMAVLSEIYGSVNIGPHAHVTLGKKRIVWGPGFFLNPTDVLNPPKDPTDPSLQRAGAWLGRLELPFERFTLSLVGAARVTREDGGVPSALVYYPDWDPADDGQPHYAWVARAYALLADTDLNLEYVFSNLYNDAFETKSRIGASFSRLVGKAMEIHGEALGQRGSTRAYPEVACVAAAAMAGSLDPCRTKLADGRVVVRSLLGARYTFADDAMLSGEYVFLSDGYTTDEWRSLLGLLSTARRSGVAVPSFGPSAEGGTPQKYNFEPQRRHYLALSYMKPRIRDDFTLNVTWLTSLHDLSGQLVPQLTWNTREWLNLVVGVYVPVPAFPALEEEIDGTALSEFGIQPADIRLIVSARAFY